MTNLADLLPAGGGQNNTDFVADGNISSGAPVILTAAGKAKAVGEDAQSASFGSTADYDTDRAYYPALVHDTASGNDVVFYRDAGNSNYGTARVVSVSGSTLTFGTAVVFATVHCDYISATYDASQSKILVVFRDDTNSQLKGIVGTVSSTSISFGSATQIGSYQGYRTHAAYNASANASVVSFSYAEGGGYSNYPYGCVATISGTSVSFGTLVRIESTGREMSTATNIYDPSSTKNLIIYRTGYEGRAAVATVSGTSVSFGTHVDWTTNPNSPSATYDSVNEKIAICFTNLSVSSYVYYIVATVSGTSVSFGTEAVVASEYGYEIRGSFDTSVNKHVTTYTKDAGADQYRFLVEGTMSGTTMSWTSPVSADNGNNAQYSGAQCFDPVANKSILAITDNTTTTAYMRTYTASGNITNLTSTNLLGIASGAISDTATGTINTWGSRNEVQTGLTIGSDYYVQTDGTIAAGSTNIAYDISSPTYTQAFSVSSQDTAPTGLAFNTDGTKMFVVGNSANAIHEYALSTGFDISSASFTQSFSTASQSTAPSGIAFKPDGTIMFVAEAYNSSILQYALSSAFDVSSASYTHNFSVAAQEADVRGVAFNTDGTVMLITGIGGDDVNEYALSSAYDVSSASFTDLFSISSQDANPQDLLFNSDGTTMWIVGDDNDSIFQYTLSSGFDVSTASYASVSFSVAGQDTSPMGMAFNSDGTKLYVVGGQNDSVYQYATTATSFTTDHLIGKAITATQINIKDYTG